MNTMQLEKLQQESVSLLRDLIRIPSLSREEDLSADCIASFLKQEGVPVHRRGNNVWAWNKHRKEDLPVLLLNSHHDTVKPAAGYTLDPYSALDTDGKLYGLGSNDAGGALVSLLAAFRYFYSSNDLPYNLVFVASAEEEISGTQGIASVLPTLGKIDLGIVGEPTLMQLAIAEKGLMVIDGEATGQSGHAARNEGINALYIALEDIDAIRSFAFPKVSPLLGAVKATVTQIQAGIQHNVVPDRCQFVIDVRTNEYYSNEEVFTILQGLVKSDLKARSFRLNSSGIPLEHPLVQAGLELGKTSYGSPTLSDQALMPFTTLKLGPGDSARSHTADEYIYVKEVREGIASYIELLELFFKKEKLVVH